MFKKDRIRAILPELEAAAGRGSVRTDEGEILMYSYDAGMARARPEAVINFSSPDHVAPVVRILHKAGIPFLPRLAGTVLLIDDEERMRIIMQNLLELNGFTVFTACSGEEGLTRLDQRRPDAVILDVRMPGMDGLVVLKKIRETLPELPVILVTHVDEEATREEAMRLGATAYVTKPFNFDGLKQALRQAIPSTKSPASSASE